MAVSGKRAPTMFNSSVSRDSDDDFDLFCQPCDRDDIRLSAYSFCVECEEHLCETCFNHHKRAKPSRHHTLLDKHNMPQSLQVSSTQPHALPNDLTEPCSVHKKEIIKFYCHNHNALLCSVCVTLKHQRTGCRVNYIPDISGNIVNSNDCNEIIKEIDTMIEVFKDAPQDLKEMTEKSNASLTNVLVEIKKFRKKINQRLDAMEHEAENGATSLKKDNDKRLENVHTTCDNVIKDLQESSKSIKQLNTSKEADKLFMELKTAEQLIIKKQKQIPRLTDGNVKDYHFEQSPDISTVLENVKPFGTIISKPLEPTVHAPDKKQSKQFAHQGEVNVSTSQDKECCWITGITFLTSDKLIAADYNNHSIKMISTNSYSIIDTLELVKSPWNVTTVSNNELAVTLPHSQEILFVSSSSNRLEREDTLKIDGQCYGIYCYNEQLLVLLESPAKLQIIDLKGKVLQSITKNNNGDNIFSVPRYVSVNSSFIYVSDWRKQAVIQLNWQGEVTGTLSAVGAPAGLAMFADGSFLMSDSHNRSFNIQKVSSDCIRGEGVLDDLKKPHAICWCETNKTLYISSFTVDSSVNNFVQVYKMS